MSMPDARMMAREGSVFFTLAFRPFFIAASLWSAIALAIWIGMLMGSIALPSRFDPLAWHIHEMLFGFVPAAIAGFMLTAIHNWTGRAPVHGVLLGSLAALWLLGRVACLVSAFMPLWVAAAADLAFPVTLCAVAAREIIASRNWRNLAVPVPVAVLSVANLLMYLELAGLDMPSGLGWRLGLAAIIILISVIGGRIIPAFTRNWLASRRARTLPAVHRWLDRVASGLLHAGLLGWAFFPVSRVCGVLLLVAAVLNFRRLALWCGYAVRTEPLLASLHLGYLWMITGVALLGANQLNGAIPLAGAIHALTAGAIGTMVLAVMTRVSLGHTGRPLQADGVTTWIYGTVGVAALTRVVAAFCGAPAYMLLLDLSAVLWTVSFLLFAVHYAPTLVSRASGPKG